MFKIKKVSNWEQYYTLYRNKANIDKKENKKIKINNFSKSDNLVKLFLFFLFSL